MTSSHSCYIALDESLSHQTMDCTVRRTFCLIWKCLWLLLLRIEQSVIRRAATVCQESLWSMICRRCGFTSVKVISRSGSSWCACVASLVAYSLHQVNTALFECRLHRRASLWVYHACPFLQFTSDRMWGSFRGMELCPGHTRIFPHSQTVHGIASLCGHFHFVSERELTFTFAICYRPSVCRL